MRHLIFIALWTLSCIEPLSAASRANTLVIHEIDSSMIDPFYSVAGSHTYMFAKAQVIDTNAGHYSIDWYVDTGEWDFDPQTNHIFSRIEFRKGNSVIGTFVDDEGWSYFGVENSQAKIFKSFTIDADCTALVFRGGIYAAGIPKLTIFVICGNEVKVVFNKDYYIQNVNGNTISIKKDSQGSNGYITISNGNISIVNSEYPTGKIIF